jgi:hypothetical protein
LPQCTGREEQIEIYQEDVAILERERGSEMGGGERTRERYIRKTMKKEKTKGKKNKKGNR